MTYEYNSGDSQLNDFPNPFKIENLLLATSSIILVAGSIYLLFIAKAYLQAFDNKSAVVTMAVVMMLFGLAIKFSIQFLTQLRFYVGRNSPIGLAGQLKPSATGAGTGAAELMETIRQRAIEFPEPTGPLNGLLYSFFKNLITSPQPIQAAAVQHFHSIFGMCAILMSMLISYFFFYGSPHEGVVSWMYLPLCGVSLLTPFSRLGLDQSHEWIPFDGNKALWKLVSLICFAVVAPVIVPRYFPAIPIPPMWIAPSLVLISSLIISTLFLLSLFSQIDSVTSTGVSLDMSNFSMNCNPAQLWTKLNKDFQSSWVRDIPNKSYANVPPETNSSDRGSFCGHLLEETFPVVSRTMSLSTMKEMFGTKSVKYLICIGIWAVLLSASAVAVAIYSVANFAQFSHFEISRALVTVIALAIGTLLAFRVGHLLWSRMYFKSRLIWVMVDGTFQTGEISIGNQFSGHAQSKAVITRVEDANLRIWATDIVSVSFGKDGKRFITSMTETDNFVKTTADRLKEFALEQSSVAAPTSHRDISKSQTIGIFDAAVKAGKSDSEHLEKIGSEKSRFAKRGVVKFFDSEKLFGFVTDEEGVDHFFNSNRVRGSHPNVGDSVSFSSDKGQRGMQAYSVYVI